MNEKESYGFSRVENVNEKLGMVNIPEHLNAYKQLTPNTVGLVHPVNGVSLTIDDDGRVEVFTRNYMSFRLDPTTGTATIFAPVIKMRSSLVDVGTDVVQLKSDLADMNVNETKLKGGLVDVNAGAIKLKGGPLYVDGPIIFGSSGTIQVEDGSASITLIEASDDEPSKIIHSAGEVE